VLTHLAESEAERQWFAGSETVLTKFLIGAFGKLDPQFADLYKQRTIWKEGSRSPVEHLHRHNLLGENLVAAHTVNVSDQDIVLLRDNAVAIAHCPRSNSRLGCGRAPLGKFFKNGLRVGLGTDSKASNDDLDLLAESRFAAAWHKKYGDGLQLGPQQIIELLTIKAAACLKREHELGSLDEGKLADIAVFTLPDDQQLYQSETDPYDLLFNGSPKLQALFVNGVEIKGC
jgi:5-methylthioadenosine/S-adenosylhomocysteine deaminase